MSRERFPGAEERGVRRPACRVSFREEITPGYFTVITPFMMTQWPGKEQM